MEFGKYNLIEKIGEGGLAEVYFAQNTAPDTYAREVVIKRIHQRLSQDSEFSTQFLIAAEQCCFLNHHNIAQTFESGIIDDNHFIAQENIEGLNLEQILNRHEQLLQAIPIEITLEIILQVCEALTYAYWARDDRGRQLHMVHRNLKPSNIMVNRHGVIKVVDFGLINAGQHMGSGQGSMVLRMAAYMSPEQAKGEEVDNRSDIFSLGTIFYEMLTLKPLFCMDNPLQTLRMVQEGNCDSQLDELAQHPVGQGLLPLLKSMLGASPWDRPTEAKQLIPHLRSVLGRLSQQIYLPNWIQDEMAAMPKARKSKPTPGASQLGPTQGAGEQGRQRKPDAGGQRSAARPPGPGQKPPGPRNPPAEPPGPIEYRQTERPVDVAVEAAKDALKGMNPKYLAIGAAVLGVLFMGLLAIFALSGGEDEAPPPSVTRVKITSSPPGARVYIPGASMPRTTPFEFVVPSDTTSVDLRADLDGFEPATAHVLVTPNGPNHYNFVLESSEDDSGTLEVHTYPPNGRLYLDGVLVEGEESYNMKLEANRSYILRLAADGYAPKEESVKVLAQGYQKVSLALDLLPETRFIDSTP